MGVIADRLETVYETISDQVLGGNYILMEESPIRYPDQKRQTQIGYLWVIGKPGGDAVFRWRAARSAWGVKEVLPPELKGLPQIDAYAAYDRFAKPSEPDGDAGFAPAF